MRRKMGPTHAGAFRAGDDPEQPVGACHERQRAAENHHIGPVDDEFAHRTEPEDNRKNP